MTLKSDVHVFTGMQKDLDVAKHKAEFLYDAHNIRFTAIDDDTLFCITNEKSTQEIESSSNTIIEGSYLGHCVIDDIVVLFTKTKGQQSKDCIYKIKINTENQNEYDITTLYKGNLNFNFNNLIETLGIFENKDIQKVYWIDGLNQPRVIRVDSVGESKILPEDDTQFDFVPSLTLEEEVTVERYEGDGMFASGVIQYAFAYYNKYGRESNIFYTTPLHYISFSDRGGSPEDRIANSFRITITNVEKNKFDYLRVFSIHRTSIDAIPTCKRVVDIELSILDNTTATFIDNGTIGDIIDNTELLYIGGENIVPYTMTQKDNTLFFGNYEITRLPISSELKAHIKNSGVFDTVKDRKLDAYEVIPSSRYYEYVYSKEDRRGFKIGEHYRLGLQFQHKSGKWSEPIFIRDYTVKQVEDGLDRYSKTVIENRTNSYIDVSSSPYWDELQNNGYIKYREVCVFPNILDRLVLTQGIVNPTVFNFRDRSDGAPFAQSSWFFRPNPVNDEDLDKIPEFRHNHILGTRNHLNAEVFGQVELGNDTTYNYPRTDSYKNTYHTGVTFGVDQSILTMHSPEIEFDDNFHFLDYTQYKFRLVGVSWLGANIGALDIQTSSASGSGKSIYDYPVYLAKRKLTSTDANQSLITSYYNDVEVDENYKIKTESGNLGWIYHDYIVYPWHKTGSLNNDVTRPSTMVNNENQTLYIGAQSAVLKTKKMSNLKYFFSNTFFNDPVTTININKVQLFADDQVTLKKIPYLENTEAFKTVSYYGNVDTAISATGAGAYIPIKNNDGTFDTISYAGNSKLDKTAIRIKYKSTKHLVFSLSSPDQKTHVLPVLDGTPTYNNLGDPVPYWFKEEEKSKEEEHNEHSNTKLVYVQLYQDMTLTEAQANPTVNAALNNFLTEDNINKDGLIVLKSPTIADKYQLYTVAYSGNTLSIVTYHNTGNKIYVYFFPNQGGNYIAFTESGSGGILAVGSDITIDPDDVILINDYTVSQRVLYSVTTGINNPTYPYLFLAELYREPNSETDFGGNTEEALKSNLWLPAGEPKKIPQNGHITLRYEYGDTWYQRYDCLKTYPFTLEDENSIVEIGSFECETRVNVEGRYDRNRGENNNLVMTPINFNLVNKVYSQKNNFFNYRILDKDFYRLNKFPNTITWTKEKTNASTIDLWTNVTAAETFDLDGIKGQINALRTFNDKIYGFQDNALSLISFNPRVQISTSDGVPIEIANSKKMEGKVYISDIIGCTNKWTITVTPSGIYFIDSNSKELYNIGQQLGTVSGTHGFSNWFKGIDVDKYRTFYDYNDKDLYILDTPTNDIDNSLVFSEYLGQFSSFMNYGKAATMFNIDNNYYAFTNDDDDTMMYRIKGSDDSYNTFFGTTYPFDITFISNADASEDKIFTNLELRSDFYINGELAHRKNFDYIQVYNEYQNTNKVNLTFNYKVASNLKKKFRIWRMDIPRDYGSMNRIRNTWTTVKLGMNDTEDLSKTYMKLHDLVVQYYI